MKKVITFHIFMTVVAVVCLWFSFIPTAHDFAALPHHLDSWFRLLIDSVHNEHWDIAYAFSEECPEDRRAQAKELEEAITFALQTWLQPLREIETQAPIVNEFRFHQLPEPITLNMLKQPELAHLDLVVHIFCKGGRSSAGLTPREAARLTINAKIKIGTPGHTFILIHEIGHAFGLGDTYVDRARKPSVTKGGLAATVGTQPLPPCLCTFTRTLFPTSPKTI